MSLSVTLCVTLALHALPDAQQQWPHPRGDASQRGLAKGTLTLPLEEVWSQALDERLEGSALVLDGRVILGAEDGHLRAFELRTGKQLYAHDLGAPIAASPSKVGDVLVIGDMSGVVHGRDPKTGKALWRYATGGKVLGSATAFVSEGKATGVIGSYDAKIHAIDVETGKASWVYTTDNYVHGSPAISSGLVVVGGCDGVLHVLDAKRGTNAGSVTLGPQIGWSPAMVGSVAYVGHYGKRFEAWNLDKGEAMWRYQDRAFPYFSSPALSDTLVVFGGRDQRIHALDRHSGDVRWVHRTRGKVDASPVIVGDQVIVGSHDGRLRVLSMVDGKALWTHDFGSPVVASPAVAAGHVVALSEAGQITVFRQAPASSRRP